MTGFIQNIRTTLITQGLFALLASALLAQPPASQPSPTPIERDLLLNTDFSLISAQGDPTAWFRAMMPAQTQNLRAGVRKESGGNVIFMSQDGTQGSLFNNWAQRIEHPPVGAPLRIEAEVATEKVTGKGGVVILMFFDSSGGVTGALSSEGKMALTNSMHWTKVTLNTTVPPRTTTAIMRIGLSSGSTGTIKARSCRVIQTQIGPAAPIPDQLIVNPDFRQGELHGNPIGWFRAMIPAQTQNLKAGLAHDDKGPYLYLSQDGTNGALFNNWAQRIEALPPTGTRLRLEAEAATRDATKGAVIMVMFFGADDQIVGAISSEGKVDLTGTKTWTPISIEGTVPPGAAIAIVRCGLGASGSGVLYVRKVTLHKK